MGMGRLLVLAGFTLVACAAAVLAPATPQPQAYHAFADTRELMGVPNAGNTASNIGFLLAGAAGLALCSLRRTSFASPAERLPYVAFFAGMALTAFGSGYYHLQPDNERLFWDRLPMTVAFMGLIAGQIGDRIHPRLGLATLVPLLVVGAASVVYWRSTERAGAGNLVPYAVLQGYAAVIVVLMAWLTPSRYTGGHAIFFVVGWYVLAKLLEHFDREIYALGHLVSGHSLKHLAAAMAGVAVFGMLRGRTLR
jgi:hypothetical protein